MKHGSGIATIFVPGFDETTHVEKWEVVAPGFHGVPASEFGVDICVNPCNARVAFAPENRNFHLLKEQLFLFSPAGFKGNLSLLDILYFFYFYFFFPGDTNANGGKPLPARRLFEARRPWHA